MSTPDKAYFITITTIGWVDLFTRLNHKNQGGGTIEKRGYRPKPKKTE